MARLHLTRRPTVYVQAPLTQRQKEARWVELVCGCQVIIHCCPSAGEIEAGTDPDEALGVVYDIGPGHYDRGCGDLDHLRNGWWCTHEFIRRHPDCRRKHPRRAGFYEGGLTEVGYILKPRDFGVS